MAGKLLTQIAAAKMLGVDRSRVRRWTELGVIPVFRDPDTGRPMYPEDALTEWARRFADNVKGAA